MIAKPKDFLAGVFFIVAGGVVLCAASYYSFGTIRRMGPGFFPVVLSIIMTILGGILVLRSFFGKKAEMPAIAVRPLVVILGSCLLFALLMRPAGLLVALAAMVMLGATASDEISPLEAAGTAVVLALGSWFIFAHLLGQPLPVLGYWFS